MKDITKEERLEYAVLSHLVQFARQAKLLVERIGIENSYFSSDSRSAAFRALMNETSQDAIVRGVAAVKNMPELADDGFLDFFNGLAASTATIRTDFREFVSVVCERDLRRGTEDINMRSFPSFEARQFALAALNEEVTSRYTAARDMISTITLPPCGDEAAPTPEKASAAPSQGAIDESLLNVPGFVNELTEYMMLSAHRPNRVLSFAGSLVFLAHLAGRKFVGPRDAYPNLYIIALAGSATGKDHPRKVIKNLAANVRMSSSVIQNVASGQGLEDALLNSPTLLCQFDEYDSVLRELKSDRNSSTATESLWRLMLSVFTSSGSIHTTRAKAAGPNKPQGREDIVKPSFSMFATATPSNFYSALSQRALTGGLLGRCLVFEAGPRSKDNFKSGLEANPVPYFVTDKVSRLAAMPPPAGDRGPIQPYLVQMSPEAEEEARKVSDESDALYEKAAGDAMEESVWGRSVELVLKLALLHAISADIERPVISVEGVRWAWALVKAIQGRMLQMARDYSATNETDEKVLAAIRIIRKAGDAGVMRSVITKRLHVTKYEMDRIEETLEDRDEITILSTKSANGKGTKYVIKKGNAR